MAILFVTHFLDQVYAMSDRITVLRNGERVGEYLNGRAAAAGADRARWSAASSARRRSSSARGGRAAGRRDAAAAGARPRPPRQLHPVDLESAARRGGRRRRPARLGPHRAGAAAVRRSIAATAASCASTASRCDLGSPTQTRSAHGMAFCPEDRKTEGIVAELSVRENIVLALQARLGLCRTFCSRGSRPSSRSTSCSAGHPSRRPRCADRAAVRRQPAEGDARRAGSPPSRGC